MKKCEKCNLEHDETYGSGRFCSKRCSRSFSTSCNRLSANEKIRKTWERKSSIDRKKSPAWKELGILRKCKFCSSEFEAKRPHQSSCSRQCVRTNKEKIYTPEQKLEKSKNMSQHAKRRHASGEEFGWRSRSNLEPSYPESIAIKFFEYHNISYVREMRVGKYFIDFAIEEQKIAIEIDGQQHNKPERKISDDLKDQVLLYNGWKVFRISWPKDNIIDNLKEILNM